MRVLKIQAATGIAFARLQDLDEAIWLAEGIAAVEQANQRRRPQVITAVDVAMFTGHHFGQLFAFNGNAQTLADVSQQVDAAAFMPQMPGQDVSRGGAFAQVVAKEGEYVTLRLGSTEMRLIHGNCSATIGEVGNSEHELQSHGKAGKSRWLGKRPKVRGEVMNPVDHPHGGRTRGGRNVVSPWGKPEGVKTRNKKKSSQRLIVRGRKRGRATQ